MRMFEHNSLFSVLGGDGGEQVLDFHHCAALGLNKAIVRPGLEGLQKKKKRQTVGPAAEVGTLRSPC